MHDIEGNLLKLREFPNGSILILGSSGYGKTYFCCRRLEEICESGKNAYILDVSGSYTEDQLRLNEFKYPDKVQMLSVRNDPLYWLFPCDNQEEFSESLTDFLVEALKLQSFRQEDMLAEVISQEAEESGKWSMEKILCRLHRIEEKAEKDDVDVAKAVIKRLRPYRNLKNFVVMRAKLQVKRNKIKPLQIIQISNLPEKQKRFLSELIVDLIWKEAERQARQGRVDYLLLDEFQHFTVKAGSALSGILREGRKHGLSVILCSQFVNGYSYADRETLYQVGNILFFRPTVRECRAVAKLIETENAEEWSRILDDLKVGEAVIKGCYSINDNNEVMERPIICRV